MANRLSKITTRTGDDGSTGLGDGTRIHKSARRVDVLGAIDEANSCLGVLLCEDLPAPARARLLTIQNQLFDLGGEVSIPGYRLLTAEHSAGLDTALAEVNAMLPPLKEFILPGGCRAAALCHVARTVVRRAERALAALAREESASAEALQYLNRLSDYLFVLARHLNRAAGTGDVLWQRQPQASLVD